LGCLQCLPPHRCTRRRLVQQVQIGAAPLSGNDRLRIAVTAVRAAHAAAAGLAGCWRRRKGSKLEEVRLVGLLPRRTGKGGCTGCLTSYTAVVLVGVGKAGGGRSTKARGSKWRANRRHRREKVHGRRKGVHECTDDSFLLRFYPHYRHGVTLVNSEQQTTNDDD